MTRCEEICFQNQGQNYLLEGSLTFRILIFNCILLFYCLFVILTLKIIYIYIYDNFTLFLLLTRNREYLKLVGRIYIDIIIHCTLSDSLLDICCSYTHKEQYVKEAFEIFDYCHFYGHSQKRNILMSTCHIWVLFLSLILSMMKLET